LAKRTNILVIDDEPRLVRFVRSNLESAGYEVLAASDGRTALEVTEKEEPNLILLDIMLPEMDGYEICRRIREFSEVPIIMLTARGAEEDKVRGLELGADDYLTKPFGANELLARIKAVLRRTGSSEAIKHQPVMTLRDLTIDFARRRVEIRGQEIPLTPTEYNLLYQLATNAGRVMLHEELLTRVWGPQYRDEIEYLRVYVSYLRRKIEDDPANPWYVLSKPGVGYMFVAPGDFSKAEVG
jgi:two-component system KDP operon response regulator KdpE